MKLKNIYYLLILVFTITTITSCKSDTTKEETKTEEHTVVLDDSEYFKNIDAADLDAINEVIQGFSSPVEMAAIIEDLDMPFAKKYLADTKVIDDYQTNIKKSLGLGFLSADMGYLNIYQRTALMVEYLLSIKGLADDLSIGQFFDFQSLKRLVDSSENMDSLLFMTTTSFFQMDEYLRTTDRSYLSACLITGVWTEGFYLMTQVAKENTNADLKDQIGSQKDILTKLIHILKIFDEHPNFAKMVTSFEELEKIYEEVTINTYEVEPLKKKTENGVVYYPRERTEIVYSDETLQKIIVAGEKVRNDVINLK